MSILRTFPASQGILRFDIWYSTLQQDMVHFQKFNFKSTDKLENILSRTRMLTVKIPNFPFKIHMRYYQLSRNDINELQLVDIKSNHKILVWDVRFDIMIFPLRSKWAVLQDSCVNLYFPFWATYFRTDRKTLISVGNGCFLLKLKLFFEKPYKMYQTLYTSIGYHSI